MSTFRVSIQPKARYDDSVRQAVLDCILGDKLNINTTKQALKRDFLLELSTGILYDCLDYAIRKFDGAEFRAKVLREFAGPLCVDEIHLGHRVVLLASDPAQQTSGMEDLETDETQSLVFEKRASEQSS